MKLSISNIAWSALHDEEMYRFLCDHHIDGLEIAPTRVFPQWPYERLTEAKHFAARLKEEFGLAISSMQSIWYGMTESIFGPETDRRKLLDYTKKAIEFAAAIECRNIVFGCPKNRAIPYDADPADCLLIALDFFDQIGRIAADRGTWIAIEPNPPIYQTNFINTTEEAFDLCKRLNNPGVKVNVDLGTLIHDGEDVRILKDHMDAIRHIHISEPHLAPIEKRALHKELIHALRDSQYDRYVSIEMGNQNHIALVKETLLYVKALHDEL